MTYREGLQKIHQAEHIPPQASPPNPRNGASYRISPDSSASGVVAMVEESSIIVQAVIIQEIQQQEDVGVRGVCVFRIKKSRILAVEGDERVHAIEVGPIRINVIPESAWGDMYHVSIPWEEDEGHHTEFIPRLQIYRVTECLYGVQE